MSDLIDRQDAIDAICKACTNSDDYVECVERRPESTFCDEIVALRKLPPAQPKHNQTTPSEQTKTDKFGVKTGGTCEDCISRQAAIDAMANTLWHYPNECYRNLNEYEFAKGLAELGLKSVPSAQPEAKPPKWVAEDRYVKNRFAVFPHCPQCNASVTMRQCYCMICGQHIDWSEEDG